MCPDLAVANERRPSWNLLWKSRILTLFFIEGFPYDISEVYIILRTWWVFRFTCKWGLHSLRPPVDAPGEKCVNTLVLRMCSCNLTCNSVCMVSFIFSPLKLVEPMYRGQRGCNWDCKMLILYRISTHVYWLSRVDLVHRYSEFYLETRVRNPTLNQPMQSQLFTEFQLVSKTVLYNDDSYLSDT